MQGTGLIIFPLLIFYKNVIKKKKKTNPSNKIKNRKSRFRVD